MEDNLSTKSSDSLTTSGEYEMVPEAPILSAVTNPIGIGDSLELPGSKNIDNSSDKKESKSPTLNIANNGDFLDLKNDMTEVINELDKEKSTDIMGTSFEYEFLFNGSIDIMPVIDSPSNDFLDLKAELMEASKDESNINGIDKAFQPATKALTLPLPVSSLKVIPQTTTPSPSVLSIGQSDLLSPKSDLSTPDINRVGHSVFYDCIDSSPIAGIIGTGTEKQDKPEKSDTDEEMSDIDQGCTKFSGITYLGSVNINSPRSEPEIQKHISELNSSTKAAGLKVSVSIPICSDGFVILHDDETNTVFQSYEIHRINYYAHGPDNSPDQACFAFTWSHGESFDTAVHKCHVFRCHIPEAIKQVSTCFSKAFHPPSLTCSVTSAIDNNSIMVTSITSDQSGNPLNTASYDFIVTLNISEKIDKKTYTPVARDRSCFKLHYNTDKEVCVTVKQTPSNVLQPLFIERCFGVLLSPGKLVRQADMQLLEMITMGYQKSETIPEPICPYQIRAEWKAKEKAFEQLNYESPKTFLTVAVNLVIKGIQEPVRFVVETAVTIQSPNEIRIMDRFNFMSKNAMSMRFYLQLKKSDDGITWEVNSIDPSEEIIEPTPSVTQVGASTFFNNLSRIVRSSSAALDEVDDECPSEYSSDGDEPLLSGTGEVSKDCSLDLLEEWDPILKEWDSEKRPKGLTALVRFGVPEALRGKIWQKLANVESKMDMNDMYRNLITKETKCEAVILRDIHRTFPAHKCFREIGGSGQDALFKVSKAYAVYDSEVGYCQGLSFIAASLLLHMPEEDAFCVLVAIMYEYGLRELYKQGFETLRLRFYQLNRLIKDLLPKLHEHFERVGIETHMFASQWFLTLYTQRFPLYFVFHILDVFLLDGMTILFQVAITLLSICENELRQLDFEGILKYFRVSLPKKCRKQRDADRVMKTACERKIKKLKQYEEEFMIRKRNEERLEREAQIYEARFGEERKKLNSDIKEIQVKLDETNEKLLQTDKRHSGIVEDYKQIIHRQEQQITKLNSMLEEITKTVSTCKICSSSIDSSSPLHKNYGKILQQGNNKNDNMPLGPLDPLNVALQRIRELELELAEAKLAQVEAECKNQDLNHQLTTTLTEIHSNRNSWQPWLSKTINSIQEKVTTSRRDAPTFQSYTNPTVGGGGHNVDTSGNNQQKHFEGSPKMQNKLQQQRNITNRNHSVDIVPRDRPVLRDTLSFTSLK